MVRQHHWSDTFPSLLGPDAHPHLGLRVNPSLGLPWHGLSWIQQSSSLGHCCHRDFPKYTGDYSNPDCTGEDVLTSFSKA